jgi:hypothetical protein
MRPLLAALVLGVLLLGCALRALFGNVIIVEDIAEEVEEIITTVFSDSTAAVCLDTDFGSYECSYIVEGEVVTSTLSLLSKFGFSGVLIDPLILQLPQGATNVTGTYDDGEGRSGALAIRTGLASVPVDDTRSLTPEPGKQLAIVELPPGVPLAGVDYAMSLRFEETVPLGTGGPVELKALLTGKVSVAGNVFYVPILPCSSDFASLPTLTVPVSDTAQPLDVPDAPAPCSNQVYEFLNVVPAVPPIDPFHCYAVKPSRGAPEFPGVAGVELADPVFAETARFDVTKPRELCAPADKNGEGIRDPATHLEGYRIKAARGEPAHTRRRGLVVVTQLGSLTLDTVKPVGLMVPTAKDLAAPPPPPDPAAHEVDHYACYEVKVTRRTPKLPKGLAVALGDQLTQPPRSYAVRKPTRLCAPVEKNGEAVKHAADSLLCYKVKPTARVAVPGLHASNQFGAETLDAVKEGELCLPARLL